MLWKIMQLSIIIAIIGSNNANHWAPTGLSAGIVAVLAAFVATGVISELLRLTGWLLRTLEHFKQERLLSHRIGREPSCHQLIGEEALDRRGHHGTSRESLGNAEQARIEKMKGISPLRGS